MADIVGIRFKRAGRAYYFDSSGIELKVNDCVVVETTRVKRENADLWRGLRDDVHERDVGLQVGSEEQGDLGEEHRREIRPPVMDRLADVVADE